MMLGYERQEWGGKWPNVPFLKETGVCLSLIEAIGHDWSDLAAAAAAAHGKGKAAHAEVCALYVKKEGGGWKVGNRWDSEGCLELPRWC